MVKSQWSVTFWGPRENLTDSSIAAVSLLYSPNLICQKVQANLPVLTSRDKRAITDLTKEFDIDFVALTYTCSADDIVELRQFLQSLGRDSIRVIAKVCLLDLSKRISHSAPHKPCTTKVAAIN